MVEFLLYSHCMAEVDALSERKSYEQLCPMATALDFVGDRWTILILRELLGGPARFQELRNGLHGIATNLLTGRLRRMEADGIVRRIGVGGSSLYALTEAGGGIRTAIEELGLWAARMGRVGPALHERSIRAIAMALQALLVRAGDALPAETCVIELVVDGEYAEIALGPSPTVIARTSMQPDARVAAAPSSISAYLLGETVAEAAFNHLSGAEQATRRLIAALGGPA
jgi:DNA-binding HxlR family transcriptional regulator